MLETDCEAAFISNNRVETLEARNILTLSRQSAAGRCYMFVSLLMFLLSCWCPSAGEQAASVQLFTTDLGSRY